MSRQFLFENTGIPLRHYEGAEGEGAAQRAAYKEITIDGEPCYQKFRAAGIHSDRCGGRDRRQVFRGDRQLGHRPARQPDGDVSGLKEPADADHVVNPMNETAQQAAPAPPRLDSLPGKTDRAARHQQAGRQHFSGSTGAATRTSATGSRQVIRVTKPTFTKPAPQPILDQLRCVRRRHRGAGRLRVVHHVQFARHDSLREPGHRRGPGGDARIHALAARAQASAAGPAGFRRGLRDRIRFRIRRRPRLKLAPTRCWRRSSPGWLRVHDMIASR